MKKLFIIKGRDSGRYGYMVPIVEIAEIEKATPKQYVLKSSSSALGYKNHININSIETDFLKITTIEGEVPNLLKEVTDNVNDAIDRKIKDLEESIVRFKTLKHNVNLNA